MSAELLAVKTGWNHSYAAEQLNLLKQDILNTNSSLEHEWLDDGNKLRIWFKNWIKIEIVGFKFFSEDNPSALHGEIWFKDVSIGGLGFSINKREVEFDISANIWLVSGSFKLSFNRITNSWDLNYQFCLLNETRCWRD